MSTVNYNTSYRTTGGLQRFDCLAWVNFNGTGTVAIRASGNVSSITDNNTGDYTINFTNAMPDANYSVQAVVGGTAQAAVVRTYEDGSARTTSGIRVLTFVTNTGGAVDMAQMNFSFFR